MPQFSSDVPSLCKAMGKPDFRYHSFDNVSFIPQTPYRMMPVDEEEHGEALKSPAETVVTLPLQDVSRRDIALPIENLSTDAGNIPLSRVFSVLEQDRSTGGAHAKDLNEIFR